MSLDSSAKNSTSQGADKRAHKGASSSRLPPKAGTRYADAGVDIDAGNALVETIKPLAQATRRSGSMDGLGGFGALFDLQKAGYRDPVLVSATDGVGTKLKIAVETDRLETIGIDLVAMCANDLICQGAEPLFFLDYFATSQLDVPRATRVISGISTACCQANIALIGGETAEMPGLYQGAEFDLAGFCVGAVERGAILPRKISAGDLVIGFGASGLHSNGFSLVRHVVGNAGLGWDEVAPFEAGKTLGEAVLAPTKLYVKAALAGLRGRGVHGYAHITGGGLNENLGRILPEGLCAKIDRAGWEVPPIFSWIREAGGIAPEEMSRTFNMGVGFVGVIAREAEAELMAIWRNMGESVFQIGEIADAG